MSHVDALSRVIPTSPTEEVLSVNVELTERLEVLVTMSVFDRVRFMQQADSASRKLIESLIHSGSHEKQHKRPTELFEVHDGILYRKYTGCFFVINPKGHEERHSDWSP
ncbi:Uncharacterized protein FWK35_00030106 [Aphis craccivora]|uniref:Uncharacterized protein n=1 Tax=Aphis craccivora TaxID=307492 RepID=A0A6G0Y867_APHCR|nr:Uncharacterized protein FWK35_00030106 [Aphis craccivora]